MKALILAGGLGTRLRPLTNTRPKHLLPIANVPHIEHVLGLLEAHGITEVVLTTSYLAAAFRTVVARARERGMAVAVTHETEPLGTAGAIGHAADLLDDDVFVALNGDILSGVDLGAAIEFHRSRDAEATLVLTPVEDPSIYGVVPTDPDGRVTGFIEKPPRGSAPTNLINAGVYVFGPAILKRIPRATVYSAERELFPEVAAAGAMFALRTDAYWMDIGTPEKYLQANLDALSGLYRPATVTQPGPGGVLVATGAVVAEGSRVSSCCVGAGAVIAAGARVERSVLLPDSRVEEGAAVSDSTLGERVVVRAGATARGLAVADGEVIEREG